MGVIYKVTIGDNFYIGQSINFKERMLHHKWLLKSNKHSNDYMQKAYNKHKEFNSEIIFTCTENYLDLVEEELINLYKGQKGFMNMMMSVSTKRGDNHPWTGKKHSESSKNKMSVAAKNREKPSHRKAVVDESTGIEYISIQEAADAIGIKKATLWARMNNGYSKNTFKYL